MIDSLSDVRFGDIAVIVPVAFTVKSNTAFAVPLKIVIVCGVKIFSVGVNPIVMSLSAFTGNPLPSTTKTNPVKSLAMVLFPGRIKSSFCGPDFLE